MNYMTEDLFQPGDRHILRDLGRLIVSSCVSNRVVNLLELFRFCWIMI